MSVENDKLLVHERNNKSDSIETGRIVNNLLALGDQKHCLHIMLFQFLTLKLYRYCLIG